MPVAQDPRIGSEIAGYRIEGLLGRGGMGVVYLAEQVRLRRKVALKLVAPELVEDERFRARLLRESELAASIDHPNVLPVYDAAEADGVLYVAMRYVDGTDLGGLLARDGRLEPARAVALLAQVAEALDVAHERGLVHRDVKPGNVLIATQAGRAHAYLADFGLAREASAGGAAAHGHFAGTVDYVAPEQIHGLPLDGRADQYALACVLYECLAGVPPFRRESTLGTLFAHLNEDPPSATEADPDLPSEIDAILAKALAKEPGDRYATCRDLVDETRRALGIAGEIALPTWRRLPRKTKAAAALLALALATAAVAAALLVFGGSDGVDALLQAQNDSVIQIDPRTNRASAAVKVGSNPIALAVGEGAVWVANQGDHTLSRIDLHTGTPPTTIVVSGSPKAIAVGEGASWLATGLPGTLTKLDPNGGERRSVVLESAGADIAVGEGSVWALTRSAFGEEALVRIVPATGAVAATIPLPTAGRDVAVGAGAVWITSTGLERGVLRVDPATNQVVGRIALRFVPEDIAVGEWSVWVSNRGDDSVSRIDPATSRVTQTIAAGRGVAGLAVGEGSVWVANRLDRTVTRIDAESGEVVATIEVGARPEDVAAGAGGVWVTVHAT